MLIGIDWKSEEKGPTGGAAGRPTICYLLSLEFFTKWCLKAPNKEVAAKANDIIIKNAFKAFSSSSSSSSSAPAPASSSSTALIAAEQKDLASARIINIQATRLIIQTMHEIGIPLDERDKLIFKDQLYSFGHMIGDKERRGSDLSVSSWALKFKGKRLVKEQAKKFGIIVGRIYAEEHGGNKPPKHDQLQDGRVTQVNSYTTDDHEILERAWAEFERSPF